MDEQKFKNYMRRADQLRRTITDSDDYTADFWRGYLTGLRRLYHGEQFGTKEEHEKKLSTPPDSPGYRREYGNGYRAGFLCIDPSSLAGNSGLKITDELQFVNEEGDLFDTVQALQILKRERGAEWIASATCKSVQTVRGWLTGRTPGVDSMRLLRAVLDSKNGD